MSKSKNFFSGYATGRLTTCKLVRSSLRPTIVNTALLFLILTKVFATGFPLVEHNLILSQFCI